MKSSKSTGDQVQPSWRRRTLFAQAVGDHETAHVDRNAAIPQRLPEGVVRVGADVIVS
jgi:hypothetical protein